MCPAAAGLRGELSGQCPQVSRSGARPGVERAEGNDGSPAATSPAESGRPRFLTMGGDGLIPGPIEARERELLGRLGLDERATAEDVGRTRDQLQAFLATAPKPLRSWARTQASAADEAVAILSGPTAWRGPGALLVPHARSAAQPDGPATPPVRRARPAA